MITATPQACNNYVRQVSARTAGTVATPVTREKAAYHAAKSVWLAFKKCGGSWILPDGVKVTYEDIVLLELVKVGGGSHQLVLAYRKRD